MVEKPQQFLGALVGGAIVKKAVDVAIDRAFRRIDKSTIPVDNTYADPIKEAFRDEVLREVGPVFENQTNQEPLWRSKILWASMGTILTSIGGILELYYSGAGSFNAYMAFVVTIGTAVGAILGRIFPSKAIGR